MHSLWPWGDPLAYMNFAFLPVKQTTLPELFKLTGFDENKWNKTYGKYFLLLGRKALYKPNVLLKKKHICQRELESPKHSAKWLKNAAQDGALPAKINAMAFPPSHGLPIFHHLQMGWLDCLFFFFLFFSPYFINALREPHCSSNGSFGGTSLAPSSDAATGLYLSGQGLCLPLKFNNYLTDYPCV